MAARIVSAPGFEPKARRKKTSGLETKATFADEVSGQSPPPRSAGLIREGNFRSAFSAELGFMLPAFSSARGSVGCSCFRYCSLLTASLFEFHLRILKGTLMPFPGLPQSSNRLA